MCVSMLNSLELMVVDSNVLPFIRVYSWRVLLQNWGTLRFSDHRGVRPPDMKIKDNTTGVIMITNRSFFFQ